MRSERIPEISLEGFQVVSGEMFTYVPRTIAPTCTIWYNRISFNKRSLAALNNCDHILIKVHPQKKSLLVCLITEKDKDSVRWKANSREPNSRKIECKKFTSDLFKTWDWKSDHVYRTTGKIVSADNMIMLLFDFKKPESWKFRSKP